MSRTRSAVSCAGMLLLFVTSAFAHQYPEFILDAGKREPELAKIYFGASGKWPSLRDHVGCTWKEYNKKSEDVREAHIASLPAGTADFILGKLNAALSAEPPDLPVVWMALNAAQFARDPRIVKIAVQLLEDLPRVKDLHDAIAPSAMNLAVVSGNPDQIAKVLSFLDIERLAVLEEQGFSGARLGLSAVRILLALPEADARKQLVSTSQGLSAHLEMDETSYDTQVKSRIARSMQDSVDVMLWNLDLDPNRVITPADAELEIEVKGD